jgi:short subunit dehydrogenase-like uncharacterized protein
MLGVMEATSKSYELRSLPFDPYALSHDRHRERGLDGPDQLALRRDPATGQWTGYFEMAAVNTRIVRRTNALLDHAYGREFRYREVRAYGPGLRGLATAAATTAVTMLALGSASLRPGRALLARLGPSAGQGPSPAQRAKGFYNVSMIGEGDGLFAHATIAGGDPGYGDTSRMLAESAVLLGRDAGRLPQRYGVLTPAAAMGACLLERLRGAGIRFKVSERGPASRPPGQFAERRGRGSEKHALRS